MPEGGFVSSLRGMYQNPLTLFIVHLLLTGLSVLLVGTIRDGRPVPGFRGLPRHSAVAMTP